jgi:hypothetical protein
MQHIGRFIFIFLLEYMTIILKNGYLSSFYEPGQSRQHAAVLNSLWCPLSDFDFASTPGECPRYRALLPEMLDLAL